MAKESKQQEEQKLKDCFIITPIGGNDSDTFNKADGHKICPKTGVIGVWLPSITSL